MGSIQVLFIGSMCFGSTLTVAQVKARGPLGVHVKARLSQDAV